jgi:hypothetical protein
VYVLITLTTLITLITLTTLTTLITLTTLTTLITLITLTTLITLLTCVPAWLFFGVLDGREQANRTEPRELQGVLEEERVE